MQFKIVHFVTCIYAVNALSIPGGTNSLSPRSDSESENPKYSDEGGSGGPGIPHVERDGVVMISKRDPTQDAPKHDKPIGNTNNLFPRSDEEPEEEEQPPPPTDGYGPGIPYVGEDGLIMINKRDPTQGAPKHDKPIGNTNNLFSRSDEEPEEEEQPPPPTDGYGPGIPYIGEDGLVLINKRGHAQDTTERSQPTPRERNGSPIPLDS